MNPTPPTDIASLLDTASPALTVGEVETIAREIFGLNAQAQELAGERDRNYHLREGQTDYVLKVSNPAESRPVIDFQTRALLHIAQVDPELPVPGFVRRLQARRSGFLTATSRAWFACCRFCRESLSIACLRALN